MSAVSVELVVPFHDVDPLHVVWHGNYFKYFEHAREALMRARGLDVPDLVAMDLRMMVVESHCRHLRPLRHGERFTVSARFGDVTHKIPVHYEIRADGRAVARGRTDLVSLTPAGELCTDTPPAVRARIAG